MARAAIRVARGPLRKPVARVSRAALRAVVGRSPGLGGAPGGVLSEPPAVGFPCGSRQVRGSEERAAAGRDRARWFGAAAA